jgi:hypothetical protein
MSDYRSLIKTVIKENSVLEAKLDMLLTHVEKMSMEIPICEFCGICNLSDITSCYNALEDWLTKVID